MSVDEQRDGLTSAVGAVISDASNYPGKAQTYILGRDISGLRDAVVDAVRSSGWLDQLKREAAADALEHAALTLPLWPEDRMSLRDRAAHIRTGATS